LHVQRQLADLVQEERAAMRELECSLTALDGAGERPFLVPKQLALDQRAHQSAAIHRHERTVLALAGGVHRARQHVFPCPGFATDQQGRVGHAHPLEQTEDLAHRRVAADHPIEALAFARKQLEALGVGAHLELDPPDRDQRPRSQIAFADLGAVEQRAVGRAEIAQQVAPRVPDDLAVVAAHGRVGEHQIVALVFADPKQVPIEHALGAFLLAAEHQQRAARQREGASAFMRLGD
jgi:hypothetical protein